MKFKLFNSSITLSVLISIVLIVVLFAIMSSSFIWKVSERMKEENGYLIQQQEEYEDNIFQTEVKLKLAVVVKDVSFTHMSTLNHVQNLRVYDQDVNDKRRDYWEKKIFPALDSVDNQLDEGHADDDLKARFNKINDRIVTIKSEQDKVIDKLRSGQINLAMGTLSNGTMISLIENFNSFFVPDKPSKVLEKRSAGFDEEFLFIIIFAIFGIVLIAIITYILITYLKRPINQLQGQLEELRLGNLPSDIVIRNEDFRPLGRALNVIVKRLRSIKQFAIRIGEGNFQTEDEISFERDGDFGNSLAEMQLSLVRVAEEDIQRNHINQGLANFSDILGHNTNNLEKFCDEIILNLVKFLNANQGAMFVVNDDDEYNSYLELVASYAYEKKKYQEKKVKKGQGLVGQCWTEGKRIYMTDVPQSYISITSGLGYSTPRCILIMPLVFNEEVHGVIELASFQVLKDYELGFVEKVSESISSSLASVKVNTKTQMLLGQAEQLTSRMKGQEEEMRKKVDELRVTQEESQRREEEHLREIRRLKKRLETYERNF